MAEHIPDTSTLDNIRQLQELGDYGRNIIIGVIDGLCDVQHPLINQVDVIGCTANDKQTSTGHGTAVCGAISGTDLGFAPQARLLNYPVFEEDALGQIKGCSERVLAKAIMATAQHGVDLINISGASLSVSGRPEEPLKQAIQYCTRNNILVIAATGNEGQPSETLPASMDEVLAVGACDPLGQPASFNNHGKKLLAKTLLASGVDIPVAWPNQSLSVLSGSSFATPVVTALTALILNALKKHQPDRIVTPERLTEILFNSAEHLKPDNESGQPIGQPAKTPAPRRLSIPALLAQLKLETTRSLANHTKGASEMTDPNNPLDPEIPDSTTPDLIEDELNEGAHAPATIYSSTGDPIEEDDDSELDDALEPSMLKLPTIADPAPRNNVHAQRKNFHPGIRPQSSGTDPRSMQGEDKVYVIGRLGYDFGTEARLDYFTQVMGTNAHPFNVTDMAKHLQTGDNADQSSGLIWTLKIDGIPVYAIEPDNQFAVLQYARLVNFIVAQETENVERISIAGYITGEVKLMNGHVVPKISPVLRGMYNWSTDALAKSLTEGSSSSWQKDSDSSTDAISNFLDRVYYELRNRGQSSQERAINYAASNAYQMKEIFDDAYKEDLFLNKISAEPSPVSRPNSDCWDVVLEFFNPKERLTSARKLYRYTIDVSDIIPVTVGALRNWYAY